MTTDFKELRLPDRDSWARAQLGLMDVPVEHLATSILSVVKTAGLFPAGEQAEAIAYLTGGAAVETRPNGDYEAHCELVRRSAVADFASRFFKLELELRRAEYSHLVNACCRIAPLRYWLRNLEPGLNVQLPEIEDGALREMVFAIGEIFTRSPYESCCYQEQILSAKENDPAWQDAGKRLLRQFPAIAALAPDFARQWKPRPLAEIPIVVREEVKRRDFFAIFSQLMAIMIIAVLGSLIAVYFASNAANSDANSDRKLQDFDLRSRIRIPADADATDELNDDSSNADESRNADALLDKVLQELKQKVPEKTDSP